MPTKKKGFTAEERAAMKDRVRELNEESNEAAVLARIAQMTEPDRGMARRLHAIIRETAPDLTPKTWYGMPAYAKGEKIVCFFQDAAKFKARYATLGFSDKANLDDGDLWPTGFALKALTPEVEKKIRSLVKKAIS
jgi:uncharacterized protein YdhG (YjbR/CyaY superfamily)